MINYPIDDKELYVLVQCVKKWNNYLMGKNTITFNHTNIDKVSIQDTHLEASKGKHVSKDKKPYMFEKKPKGKWKSKK
jgi:hypothetical protein